MKRFKIILGVVVVFSILLLAGCSGNADELDPAFNEEVLKQSAEGVLMELNKGNFDAIAAQVDESAKSVLTAEVLKNAWEPLAEKLGTFDKVSEFKIAPKDNTATVFVISDYEKGKSQLTLGYNTNMKIIGLWVK
ncbi:MAG: DUF3887 domain-containing protein [Eubacterium sp.]